MNRKLAVHACVIFCGVFLGAVLAYPFAHAVALRMGWIDLNHYASHLLENGNTLTKESVSARTLVYKANLPFCSDEEIALMRDFLYRLIYLKDIERTRDGLIHCTANLGRLAQPVPMSKPTVSLRIPHMQGTMFERMNIYIDAPSLTSKSGKSFITEQAGVAVTLNPDEFGNLNEPPMTYSGMLLLGTKVLRAFGNDMPLTDAEVLAGNHLERSGILYQPLCSRSGALFCVVVGEPKDALLSEKSRLIVACVTSGALAGGVLALILILGYRRQRTLERQLRRAIQRGDLAVVYQPVIDLESRRIVGAEALIRWTSEAGEIVRPDVFVALAEEKGFVTELTTLLLSRVIHEMHEVLVSGRFRVTLNMTSADLADPDFPTRLQQQLHIAKVPSSAIGLELTERSTADNAAKDAIERLNQAGHTIYIDDFGTGYSSLAYLHQMAVTAIKIDRAFTRTIGTHAITESVVPEILDMAAKLELLVVVEGIETEEQVQYFQKVNRGILGQGWLFSQPVSATDLRKLVNIG